MIISRFAVRGSRVAVKSSKRLMNARSAALSYPCATPSCHAERSEAPGRAVARPPLLLPPAPAPARRSRSLATLGMTFLGLFLGAIVGGIGALLMIFKSAKKLVTLH